MTALPPLTFPCVANPPGSQDEAAARRGGVCAMGLPEPRRGKTAPGKVKFHLVVLLGILFFPTRKVHSSRMPCQHEVLVLLPLPGEAMQAALLQPQDLACREGGGCLPSWARHAAPTPSLFLLPCSRLPPPPSASAPDVFSLNCRSCIFPS